MGDVLTNGLYIRAMLTDERGREATSWPILGLLFGAGGWWTREG